MKEPGICPKCGSDRVKVHDSRLMAADVRGRRRSCRDCLHPYESVELSEQVGDTKLTVEMVAPMHRKSIPPLRRTMQRLKDSFSH